MYSLHIQRMLLRLMRCILKLIEKTKETIRLSKEVPLDKENTEE